MLPRRSFTKLAAATTAVGLAGCVDDDDPAPPADEDDAEVDTGEVNPADWEDVEEIHFNGITEGWEGVEPAHIDGEENPTLTLFEGEEYTISFENTDGANHDLAIRDDEEQVVNDYQTELTREEGEEASLEIEATAEMAQYVCEPHQTTMVGEIQIEQNND